NHGVGAVPSARLPAHRSLQTTGHGNATGLRRDSDYILPPCRYSEALATSLAAHTFDAHLQSIQTCARRDEQCLAVLAAEADIGCPRLGHRDLLDLLARLVEHRHALAREVDVPFTVDGHAIGTQLAEQPLVLQRAVGGDVVGAGLARLDVGDVQRLAIGRADNAIGLPQVVGDARKSPVVGSKMVDRLPILLLSSALPVVTLVK